MYTAVSRLPFPTDRTLAYEPCKISLKGDGTSFVSNGIKDLPISVNHLLHPTPLTAPTFLSLVFASFCDSLF